VVQVNAPTVKVRPVSNVMEAGNDAILLERRSRCAPPTWRATVDEISAAVCQGYPHGSSVAVEARSRQRARCKSRNKTQGLPRFRPQRCVKPYVLLLCIDVDLDWMLQGVRSRRSALYWVVYEMKLRGVLARLI
jgi:hypothetical protein